MTVRVLYLMRHAAPEPTAPGGDRARELTEHGRAQAAAAGEFLRRRGPGVDQVLCSPAARTEQTLAGLGLTAPVTSVPRLYHAGGATVVDALTGLGDDITCALVVGHAPGVPAAAHLLTDRATASAELLARLDAGFGTATLARLTLEGNWTDLADGRRGVATLTDLLTPN